MIKRDKNFNQPPAKLIECGKKHSQNLLAEKANHKFDKQCYNIAAMPELLELYHSKCAYCESKLGESVYPQSEHHRPKNIYWWLGYEWSNLLPVCQICNTKKGDKFPIKGTKAEYSGEAINSDSMKLLEEQPLLLHPEIDEPTEHLAFDANGNMLSLTERGAETIKTLHLNRSKIVERRKELIDNFFKKISDLVTNIQKYDNRSLIFVIIFEIRNLHRILNEYQDILFRKYVVHNFESLINQHVSIENARETVLTIYKNSNIPIPFDTI